MKGLDLDGLAVELGVGLEGVGGYDSPYKEASYVNSEDFGARATPYLGLRQTQGPVQNFDFGAFERQAPTPR